MAQSPNYGPSEFLDSTTFNSMSAATYASLQQLGSSALTPGLIFPENVTITISGLQATLVFPNTFAAVFGNGTVAYATGNTAGSVTNTTYVANFAPVVPLNGTATGYLICTVSSVGQNPITIVGPPPGHPDFNPNFAPYTLYSITQDSITVTPSTIAPDNRTTFSLGSITLTAGMSVLPAFNQNLNYRAGALSPFPVILNSGTRTLSSAAQGIIQNVTSASIFTLPLSAGLSGVGFPLTASAAGSITVNSQGSDVILGTGTTPATSYTITSGSSAHFVAQNGAWYVMSASPSLSGGTTNITNVVNNIGSTTNNYTFNTTTPPGTDIDMSINDTLLVTFNNVTQIPVHVKTDGGVFRVIICVSGTSQVNNDLLWKANNTTYPGNSNPGQPGSFTGWATENTDAGQSGPYFNTGTVAFNYTQAANPTTNLGWFAMDAFGDGSRNTTISLNAPLGDTINDLGPCMWDVLLCTSTAAKMVKYNGGVSGGCGVGFVRWYDNTTQWTSLGTFGIGASLNLASLATITGFAYITKVGGAITIF